VQRLKIEEEIQLDVGQLSIQSRIDVRDGESEIRLVRFVSGFELVRFEDAGRGHEDGDFGDFR
jgi:hypothetical protein